MEFEKSRSGTVTLKINNKYIHSKYDPVKEAKQFAESNLEIIMKPIVLLYGLGLGYHVNEIAKILDKNSVLYVFEWNHDLVKACEETNKEIFKEDNIVIIDSKNNKFYNKLSEILNKTKDIIIHRPSLESIKFKNEELYNLISDFSLKKQLDQRIQKNQHIYEENFISNLKHENEYANISKFFEKFNKECRPYILVSAGSSLDDELDLLRDNRNLFYVFCVGSALRTLMDNKIKPDAIVIIDGHEIIKKQLEGFEDENIPLCFEAYASRWAVESYNGPKYIFNLKEDENYIMTGGTVAVANLNLALKCNAKEIVFLGQDLAFVNNKNHAKGYSKMHYDFNTTDVKTIKIDDVNGNKIKTTQIYLRFKHKLESAINKQDNIKFINCSKGASIKGTEYMEFKNYILNNKTNL